MELSACLSGGRKILFVPGKAPISHAPARTTRSDRSRRSPATHLLHHFQESQRQQQSELQRLAETTALLQCQLRERELKFQEAEEGLVSTLQVGERVWCRRCR